MKGRGPDSAQDWLAQWRRAGPALEAQRKRELRAMSDAEAVRAAEALLDLAPPVTSSSPRWGRSGLVAQQRLLHRRSPH